MKNLKLFMFTLMAFLTICFAYNVNAEDVIIVSSLDELNDALSNGGSIKLNEDITGEVVIPSGKTVTLDLGSKTVTAPSGKVAITNNGTLTIEGEGSVVADGNYAVLNHGTKLTIKGGDYSKKTPSATQSLIANGWYNNDSDGSYAEMIISGGTFDGGSYTAIKNDAYGNMAINGGTFISTISTGGIQEAGKDLTINGGTFNTTILIQNLSSYQGESKTTKLLGGTFNKEVKTAPYNGSATKASNVNLYLGENAEFNGSLNISNTYSPAGTNAFVIKQFDVKNIGGALTIGGRDADNKYPGVTLDGLTIGGSLSLSNVDESTISNSNIKGDIKAGSLTLEKVTAKSLVSVSKDSVQNVTDSKIIWIKQGVNHPNTLNVKDSEIGKISQSTNGNKTMYIDNIKLDGVTIKKDSSNSLATGEIILNGGTVEIKNSIVDTITIPENGIGETSLTIGKGSSIGMINNGKGVNASITLPKSTYIDNEGNVITRIGNYDLIINGEYTFNTKAIIPNITLKDEDGDVVELNEDNFEIDYYNNTNAGQATVTVTGIGSYTKSLTGKFKIEPLNIETLATSSTGKPAHYISITGIANSAYTGEEVKPIPTIKLNTLNTETGKYVATTLEENKDYEVTYENNIDKGTAKASIKGIGNYSGTITKEFEIKDAVYEQNGVSKTSAFPNTFGSSGTYKLLQDVVIGSEQSTTWMATGILASDVTLDLNGHKISIYTKTGNSALKLARSGHKFNIIGPGTIEDLTGNVSVIGITGKNYNVNIGKDVKLVGDTGVLIDKAASNTKLDFAGEIDAKTFGLTINGNLSDANNGTEVNIRDTAKISAEKAPAIYAAGYGSWTVAGEVIGATGIEMRAGNLTVVDGAKITGTAESTTVVPNGGGSTTKGVGIAIVQHTTKASIEVKVDGGEIKGATALLEKNVQNNEESAVSKINATINDGTFIGTTDEKKVIDSEDIQGFVKGGSYNNKIDDAYVATGFEPKENEQGMYTLEDADLYLSLKNTEYNYTKDAITPEMIVKYGVENISQKSDENSDGYTVTYSDNINAGECTVTVSYKGKTVTSKFTINKVDISNMDVKGITEKTYTGDAITQDIEIEGLTSKDYSISYKKNTIAGTAEMVISGIGNYTGSIEKTFKINKADISNFEVTGIIDKEYNGTALTQDLTVEGLDSSNYVVNYDNNINSGTAEIIIEGKGNYTGIINKTFKINPVDISNYEVSGIVDKDYTGSAITQNITVVGLTAGDFNVEYNNNINPGEATLTIKGASNYTGEITKSFMINKLDLSNYTVEGINNNEFYTGSEIKPNIVIKNGNKSLINGTDFSIKYSNNTEVGTASITITGINNYTGSINKSFDIVNPNIESLSISSPKDMIYTGSIIRQDENIVIKNGNITLVQEKDYTIGYNNNINVGTATITIKGNGKYTGEKKLTFKINPISINAKDIKVTGIINRLYTGKARKQDNVKVTYKGKTIPYSISYKNNTNIGTASVIITFKGNYKGTVTKNFDILPVKIGIKAVKGKKKKAKVTYYAAAGNVKYQIAYRKNGTKKWKYVTTSASSKTIKKLKSRKYYTFTVRAFKVVNGKTYYGAWSDMKSVRVK